MLRQIQTSIDPYAFTESAELEIPFEHHGLPGHKIIIENFVNAIRGREELIVHGEEGLNQLQLSNSILLSSLLNNKILLPMDSELFKRKLEEKVRNSKVKKLPGISLIPDISKSFGN
jgi:hypothetical protein